MADIPGRFEHDRLELNLFAVGGIAVACGGRALKTVKQIVERAILLNDDDDVLDFRVVTRRHDHYAGFRAQTAVRATGTQSQSTDEK
jgi:hypothetical protein